MARCAGRFLLLWILCHASLSVASLLGRPFHTIAVHMTSEGKVDYELNVPAGKLGTRGVFHDNLNISGWGVFDVTTDATDPDDIQAFTAGFAEGYLTATRIYEHHYNMHIALYGKLNESEVKEVEDWLQTQEKWSRKQAAAADAAACPTSHIKGNCQAVDPFWHHLKVLWAQFDGLEAGYQRAVEDHKASVPLISHVDFLTLQATGDLFQIIPAVLRHRQPQWHHMSIKEAEAQLLKMGHCSALIKVPGDLSDLLVGHSSWFVYSATNRIFKHYHFAFSDSHTAAQRISFSSYPGFLVSLDDFYLMDSGLVMTQTSLSFSNNSLYDLVHPQSLLAWQRVRLANTMARSGEEWHSVIKRHFSGTYSNQYMVVDYNLFKPGKPLVDGLLWVIEELPGSLLGEDKTDVLEYGYWPSYNVPYFQPTYALSGLSALAASGVPSASYQTAPRADIFRRDAGQVKNLDGLKRILRSNGWPLDPYSPNPGAAICSRLDLDSTSPVADGCYDTKVTNAAMAAAMKSEAINGPTAQQQPVFKWSDKMGSHLGLPLQYNFSFVLMQPADL